MKRCVICKGSYYTTKTTGQLTYDLCYDCYLRHKERIRLLRELYKFWWNEMIKFDEEVKREAAE